MKAPLSPSPIRHPFPCLPARRTERGVTLVLVLSILALLLILVVGLLSSISSETISSGSYAEGAAAKRLADSALEMVTSQIRLATSGSATLTWTSQPGLLRTFDSAGSASDVFKLYSAGKMRVPGNEYAETEDNLNAMGLTAWSRAVFADINQPATDNAGNLVYPILDPGADSDNAETGRKAVTGFSVGSAPGYQADAALSATNNRAAMPVRWLYILRDGQIAVPESEDPPTGNVTFSANNARPSADNPVTGRVAFWTDDDTCKLNVNTAGYGLNDSNYWTFWDTPLVYSNDEQNFLSKKQPWAGEYQRYPGHPATTGLHTVFPELSKTDLFKITPRLRADPATGGAGSDGGTLDSFTASPLPLKIDRLYASVDEVLYRPDRTGNLGNLTARDLDTKRFFLTVHSRAPEVNLFGQPRVTIWPVPHNPDERTALDKLIALCGTVGDERFYFTRQDSGSTSADISLTNAQGSNLDIYNYLDRLTRRPIPGFGGSANGFEGKYPMGDQRQILTGIFDTIRITNLAEKSPAVAYTSSNADKPGQVVGQVLPTEHPNGTRGAGRMFIITEATVVFVNMGSSETDNNNYPKDTTKTKLRMGVVFKFWLPTAGAIASGANLNYKISGLDTFYASPKGTEGTYQSQSLFVSQFTSNTSGSTVLMPRGTYQRGLREFRYAAVYGGANPAITAINDTEMGSYTITSNSGTFDVPLLSDEVIAYGRDFKFDGGTMTVEIRAPQSNLTGTPLQTYTFVFPKIDTALRIPPYVPATDRPWNNKTAAENQSEGSPFPGVPPFQSDGRFATGTNSKIFILQNEVARSVQSADGDYRRLAYLKDVSSGFTTPPDYYSNYVQAQSLVGPGGWFAGYGRANQTNIPQCQPGNLVQDQRITGLKGTLAPDVPIGINGVKNIAGEEGDWDNGMGYLQNGGYLPKPDEGILYSDAAINYSAKGYFYSTAMDKSTFQGNASTLFSANRQLPSAVLFGSLPTGINAGKRWQTLLFRPARAYHMGGKNHPGAASPPDYLLLDLFQMPIVEPYAISEPLSTAGKVNLNYRIKPFDDYLSRETAIRSVLESTMLTAIPEAAEGTDQNGYMGTGTPPFAAYSGSTRRFINATETLKCFDTHLSATGKSVFVSESEICDVDLVPQGESAGSLPAFWSANRLTGDNSLERPYALLYPRLTTRSNTYTVHVYAQALNPTQANRGGWSSKTGRVVGEWRGETTLERYVDAKVSDLAAFPTFLKGSDGILDPFYRFRVLSTKRFSP